MGAVIATSYAEILLSQAIRRYGPDQEVKYPDTGYYLPVIRALSGEAVTKLGGNFPDTQPHERSDQRGTKFQKRPPLW